MKNIKHTLKSKKAMTLIEIMLVLVLLGIVLSLVGKKTFSAFTRGKRNAAKIAIKQVEGYLTSYQMDCNRYPTTAQGLKALYQAPEGEPSCPNYDPAGYSDSQKSFKDPWGNELVYVSEDGSSYEIKSLGQDNKEGGEGESVDISSKDNQ